MKLSPVMQAILAIPDAGGLVIVSSREDRDELLEALNQHGPSAAADRVVIAVLKPEEVAALLRLPAAAPTFFRPPVAPRTLSGPPRDHASLPA